MIALALALALIPQDWQPLREVACVEGRGWADEPGFGRLPARAAQVVRPAVWILSGHTAGVAARFVTSATEIRARWVLEFSELSLPDTPATACSGLDLYVKVEDEWRWLASGRPTGRENERVLVAGMDPGEREYMLYLPLYNGVRSIDLAADAPIRPARARAARPVVFYGTSITQGRGASRPGTCHVARLGRMLDREVINLGFSGHGQMEPEVAALLAELDAAAIVVDCLPNTVYGEMAVPLVLGLDESIPAVLVEDRTYGEAFLVAARRERNARGRSSLRSAFDTLKSRGRDVTLIPGDGLLGPDETVDGSHPNDAGYASMARALLPYLVEVTR